MVVSYFFILLIFLSGVFSLQTIFYFILVLLFYSLFPLQHLLNVKLLMIVQNMTGFASMSALTIGVD